MGNYHADDMLEPENAFRAWLREKGKTIPQITKVVMVPKQVIGDDQEAKRRLLSEFFADQKAKPEQTPEKSPPDGQA